MGVILKMCAAISGAQANFDALGIPYKNHLLQIAADDGEQYIKEIIKKASILFRNSRSEKLSPQHINTVLESTNEPQLLGYNNSPSFLLSSVGVENSEILVVKDPIEQLKDAMNKPSPPKPRNFPFGFQWFLTEGVPAEQSRVNFSDGKVIKKGDVLRPSSVDTSSRSYSTRQFVGDVLHTKHQADYVRTINMLRDDTSNQRLQALKFLRTGKDLQPLLPYFLQFAIGELTLHYNDPVLVDIIVSVVQSLVENEYLCVSIFTHCFVRIIISILLSPDSPSKLAEEDCAIRSQAAKALEVLCERCEDAYPDIRVAVFNRLVETLFDPKSTLSAHFGALSGIEVLGQGAIQKLIPHLTIYCKLTTMHQTSRQQKAYVLLIKNIVFKLINKIEGNPAEMTPEITKAVANIKKIYL